MNRFALEYSLCAPVERLITWKDAEAFVDNYKDGWCTLKVCRVISRGLQLSESLGNLAVIIIKNSLPKSMDNFKYKPLLHFSQVLEAAMSVLTV